jgi:hypothetical protein
MRQIAWKCKGKTVAGDSDKMGRKGMLGVKKRCGLDTYVHETLPRYGSSAFVSIAQYPIGILHPISAPFQESERQREGETDRSQLSPALAISAKSSSV